jgi:cytochrome P450
MTASVQSVQEAPFLKGHWLKGVIDERKADPYGLFSRMSTMGDVVGARVLHVRAFLLNHPDAIKHVWLDNAQGYWKGKAMKFLTPLLGEGLFTAEGELWKRNRRLTQPAFHRERLAGLVSTMADAATGLVDRWADHPSLRTGEPFDVMSEMMALTMSIAARTLFSTDVSGDAAEVGKAMSFALEETNRRLLTFNPLVLVLPTRRYRQFEEAKASLDRIIYKIIDGRRRRETAGHDLLAMLMEARDADTGEQMNDRQLRDEVMTIFLAGHETTAVALTWLFYLLAQHPEVEARMRAEIREVLDDRPATAADLPRLKYTLMAIEEAMRLYPPAWLNGRQALRDDVVMGYRIPAGSHVIAVPWVLHRSPRFWEQPERFDPERFSPERSAQRPRLAYFPFGIGQRMCIGFQFALMEAQVIAARVLQRFHLALRPGTPVEPDPQVTLRPRGGMPLVLQPADRARAAA